MSESRQERHSRHEEEQEVEAPQVQAHGEQVEIDDILDEIDGVLETNAEEFVRSFVQKGGQ
ncbi:hypothetical protein GCM10027418_12150 [Mariniluteicoccus endophyticus]